MSVLTDGESILGVGYVTQREVVYVERPSDSFELDDTFMQNVIGAVGNRLDYILATLPSIRKPSSNLRSPDR